MPPSKLRYGVVATVALPKLGLDPLALSVQSLKPSVAVDDVPSV